MSSQSNNQAASLAGIQTSEKPLGRDDLARLVARDIKPGSFVNLGIGQPTLVSNYLEPEQNITLHTENAAAALPARGRQRRG